MNNTHNRTHDEKLDAAISNAQNLTAIAENERTRRAWMTAANAWGKAGNKDKQQVCIYNADLCKS